MNQPNDTERERLVAIVQQHAAALAEHFENVQIFCSSVEEGGDTTLSTQIGSGNIHARVNHARSWVIRQDEEHREEGRRGARD